MAEQEHTHHHHHHHKPDGATLFKRKSLAAIERRKVLERVLKRAMIVFAILMVIAVLLVYTIG
jgi:preprotein translocase subunit SecG